MAPGVEPLEGIDMARRKHALNDCLVISTNVASDFSGICQVILDGEFRWACWFAGRAVELSIVGAQDAHLRRMTAPLGDELLRDLDASFLRVKAQFDRFVDSQPGYRATCTELYRRIDMMRQTDKALPATATELLALPL